MEHGEIPHRRDVKGWFMAGSKGGPLGNGANGELGGLIVPSAYRSRACEGLRGGQRMDLGFRSRVRRRRQAPFSGCTVRNGMNSVLLRGRTCSRTEFIPFHRGSAPEISTFFGLYCPERNEF